MGRTGGAVPVMMATSRSKSKKKKASASKSKRRAHAPPSQAMRIAANQETSGVKRARELPARYGAIRCAKRRVSSAAKRSPERAGADVDAEDAAVVTGLFTRTHTTDKSRRFLRQGVGSCALTKLGLEGSFEYHRTDTDLPTKDRLDRAVLVQCEAHYARLDEMFPGAGIGAKLHSGGFGENVVIAGLDATTVCVGDRFAVMGPDGEHRGFEAIVTQPRRPCAAVDFAHGKTHRPSGVRDRCATGGLAGFFLRVEPVPCSTSGPAEDTDVDADTGVDASDGCVLGEIAVGDKLVLTSRSWPTWTLARVSGALYGGWGGRVPYGKWYKSDAWDQADVSLSDEELAELADMPELADDEWKNEVKAIQEVRRNGYGWRKMANDALSLVFGWTK